MPRKTPLPEREKRICERLRWFRESKKIPRTAFALEIGIGSDRLGSYEGGRARLRYEVFSAITKRFFLLPHWLATGIPPVTGIEAFNESQFEKRINPKLPFSEVYDSVLEGPLTSEKYQAQIELRRLAWMVEKVLDSLPVEYVAAPDYLWAVENLASKLEALSEKLEAIIGRQSENRHPVAVPSLGKKSPANGEKIVLAEHSECDNLYGVKSPMKILLGRLALATEARGKKAALAKFLRVDPPRVSDWLRGNYEPSGEVTLRLLEWVAAEEAQQKTPGGAETAAKGKTRLPKDQNEQDKSRPERK